jgi:hypothetical protein
MMGLFLPDVATPRLLHVRDPARDRRWQRIAGSELLAGPAVNVAQRLLKNSITAETGVRAYLFVSEEAAAGLDLRSELGAPHQED